MAADAPDRYGVIGYPVSHSRSPVIHRLFALQTGQNMQYELLQVPPEKLVSAVLQFRRTGGRGLNVTVPHKTAVVELVDELSERAASAGAVNTLTFAPDMVRGDNTDGVGLIRDLQQNLGQRLANTNILILGAGGATRGIVRPLLESGPSLLTIANRTVSKAEELRARFAPWGRVTACSFDDIDTSLDYGLIVNATSAGLKGETPPYPAAAVGPTTCCYDLSYGLQPTPFCLWGAANGAALSVMGWGMLVEQAAESFYVWRGVRPDTAPVLKQLSVSAS
ncbi:MAG: shikimate dehydrogenase [Gammaproteobacteria bacterium]|nr:shikimate dehydrogenase [Gammaproteobacteria bacterium]MDH4253467.1 shikimate dehydrogenase [Gammaproteobacteria bacterium]MDH5309700.1 shikimate dehydrogenase [Gammaproteobacteria bacterium]